MHGCRKQCQCSAKHEGAVRAPADGWKWWPQEYFWAYKTPPSCKEVNKSNFLGHKHMHLLRLALQVQLQLAVASLSLLHWLDNSCACMLEKYKAYIQSIYFHLRSMKKKSFRSITPLFHCSIFRILQHTYFTAYLFYSFSKMIIIIIPRREYHRPIARKCYQL